MGSCSVKMNDDEFLESSEIFVLATQATELGIKELFTEAEGESPVALGSITQRSTLYFDELLPIYVALRTPRQNPTVLKRFTERLSISLELWASGLPARGTGQNAGKQSSPGRQEDVIWRGTLAEAEQPVIVGSSSKDEAQIDNAYVVAVWECKALLSRPRFRLQSPAIAFTSSAVLKPDGQRSHHTDPYLPSGLPAPENLLAPLGSKKTTDGNTPSLSSFRLHRVQPFIENTQPEYNVLKVSVPEPCRAVPAIASRIRHHKSPHLPGRSEVVAALDMEIAPFSNDRVEIMSIAMKMTGGTVADLGQGRVPCLPLQCKSKDNIVFLYRLALDDSLLASPDSGSSKILDIAIDAIVLSSNQCKPHIQMRWSTSVDFSAALNPDYGAPRQSMQRLNKPSSLSVPPMPAGDNVPSVQQSVVTQKGQGIAPMHPSGVTITFSAPPKAYVREEFYWDVLILNKSGQPVHLTISALAQNGHGMLKERMNIPSSETSSQQECKTVANAVVDENVLYMTHRTGNPQAPDLLALSSTVDLGVLNPETCHSTQLKFVALATGHLQTGPIRVKDEQTKAFVDVTDLPDVLVVQKSDG